MLPRYRWSETRISNTPNEIENVGSADAVKGRFDASCSATVFGGFGGRDRFFAPQGDYRLCKYSSIKMNEKISDDVFKLKTTGKTQTISPRG